MSSHREAPEISKDPAADTTDVYAFVHPTEPGQVVLICNFIPLQQPNAGPNFFEFADDVLYAINVSNTNACIANVRYEFRFTTTIRNPNTFLYTTGPVTKLTDTTWNRPQTYTVTRVVNGKSTEIAANMPVPPCNVGTRSTPNYPDLAMQAVTVKDGRTFFAGQRADAFYVDLGSIFDLGALRPFNHLHLISQPDTTGVNAVQAYNVHTIAISVPASDLTKDGSNPSTNPLDRKNVVGVWSSADRRKVRVFRPDGIYHNGGPNVQVSRLGNPLFNEVLVPMSKKDLWNSSQPANDKDYATNVTAPELGGLLPYLYPNVFPNLAAYKKPRADLAAILLTGIPYNVVPGFQNYTGASGVQADMLRLNMAVPHTDPKSSTYSEYGVVGGDLQGFPNGRRITDNVVAIELRAIAGVTIPLVDPSYKPDGAAGQLTDGTSNTNAALLDTFPFLGHAGGGYETQNGTTTATSNGNKGN